MQKGRLINGYSEPSNITSMESRDMHMTYAQKGVVRMCRFFQCNIFDVVIPRNNLERMHAVLQVNVTAEMAT